ncbi:MAG: hypothetical protein HWQ44_05275 [Nostoc sp. JL34]|uniref:hypothetical protein n=1 Tax=unclassified Nostoc TaxID=2593658 RepID=UPI001E181D68|nr:hypothetical protein [Nostoc sp. JL34]MBN3882405.1 hypothetical protein [Nostoc sp. JL34]
MIQQQKFQKFNYTEKLVKNYNFQVGEIITGSIVPPESFLTVSPGMPDKFLGSNSGFEVKGKVHKVNDTGEFVSLLLTEINPPSNHPNANKIGDIISLLHMESYSLFLVE